MKLLPWLVAAAVLAAAAGPAFADSVQSEARVKNRDPEMEEVTIEVDDDDESRAGLQVAPSPGGSRDMPFTARAKDNNGWQDLDRVRFKVLDPSGREVASGDAPRVTPGQGARASHASRWSFPHYTEPGTYTLEITVTDKPGAKVVATLKFDIIATMAMGLDATSVNLGGSDGSIEPGASNHASPAQVRVLNLGNVALDLGFAGTPLQSPPSYGASIPVERVRYSNSSSMAGEVPLGGDPQTDLGFNLAPGDGASRSAYFDLHAPSGDEQYIPATTYQGTITLSAVVDA